MHSCRLFSRPVVASLQGKARSLGRTVQAAQRTRFLWLHASFSSKSALGLPLPLSERPVTQSCSVQQLLAWRSQQLRGIEAAGDELEALDNGPSASLLKTELEWLLEDTLGSRQDLQALSAPELPLAHGNERVEDIIPLRLSIHQLDALWTRRFAGREPLQYLTSAAHWRDMVLAVGPGALIPRPETELMVDFAEQAVKQQLALAGGNWADLGTGSGALAAGLARSCIVRPQQVWAVEQSSEAAAWAHHNFKRLGITATCQVLNSSWDIALQEQWGLLSGILTNPPYIASKVIKTLQAEVEQYEPREALDGGGLDGLPAVESVCRAALLLLKPGGFLAIETGGPEQTQHVAGLLGPCFQRVEEKADLSGVVRFVTATSRL
ncbi:hypothetical protein WJX74_006366 [Apatococcus lobatus]|uniref:Methyltransferase small domain-containing protein n=1 Tax=Apatococcus lobatus TaxID=904363 RepID=A0AAW1RD02_9CHLO